MRETLSIIGAGRVGRALGRQLHSKGWNIGAIFTQGETSARRAMRFIGGGSPCGALSTRALASTVIIIATPDTAIPGVARELARIADEELRGKIVIHTSGALDSGILSPLHRLGASVASMHPLQTFSGVDVPPLEGRIFAVEGDPLAVRKARTIARLLGGLPVRILAERKPLYHAAGAFAAGHALTVVEAATQLLMFVGMKRREATRALLPMTRQVLDNYERLGPRRAWTGPLSRGDHGVLAKHLEALRQFPSEFESAYAALNRLALSVHARDTRLSARARNISLEDKARAKSSGGSE